jgi:hypothetical protein
MFVEGIVIAHRGEGKPRRSLFVSLDMPDLPTICTLALGANHL